MPPVIGGKNAVHAREAYSGSLPQGFRSHCGILETAGIGAPAVYFAQNLEAGFHYISTSVYSRAFPGKRFEH